ncbi:hypothetical protein [Streptomyces sp. NPDC055109]
MTDRDDALQQAMERTGRSMVKAIKRHLVIEPEPSPLPPPDSPLYELSVMQHRLIAHLRARLR